MAHDGRETSGETPPGGGQPPGGGYPPGGGQPPGGSYPPGGGQPPGGGYPPGGGQPPGGGYPPGYAETSGIGPWQVPGPRTDGFATASFVVGLFSVVCPCWFLFAVPTASLVFGIVGLSRIQREPARYSGKALAVAGMVMSAIALAVMLVTFLVSALTASVEAPWDMDTQWDYYYD